MSAHIKLQTSYGDFASAFVEQLPALEKAMRDQGLDPSAFVIAKHEAAGARLPIAYRPDGNPAAYTVFVKDKSFTVTQPDDMSFLAYFYRLCVPPPEHKETHGHSAETRLAAFIHRLEHWFNQPI